MDALCDKGAVELAGLIAARAISPVELLDACLARIDAVNPRLNAIVALDRERARAAARAAEARAPTGPLHGLPIGIKDLQETAGLRTTYGSPLYADYVPAADERIVAQLRQAGAIVLGKTNTSEFGAGANTVNAVYGATRNPFDPARSCGGSSGGAGVALATGMVPLATGSDTGGSLRIPAAFCGVAGFRPSPGLVPAERRALGWSPLTVLGPMARSVADLRLLLAQMAGFDARDPLSAPSAALDHPPIDLKRLRVAVSEDLGGAPVSRALRAALRERIALIAPLFGSLTWRDPPMAHADRAFAALRAQGFLAAHAERYESHRDQLGPNVRANYEEGLAMSAAEVAWAHRAATRIYHGLENFFADVDLLISPTVGAAPFPIEDGHVRAIDGHALPTYYSWLAPTYYLSLTGQPALSLPCGLESTGTPFALQLCAAARRDGFLLAAAAALEAELQHDPRTARPRPDIAKLTAPASSAP